MDSKNTDRDVLEKQLNDLDTPPIYLPLDFLEDITNNFSREQELGKGGYGAVYKGVLRSGKIIAVKKLFDIHLVDDEQFQKEVTNLMGTKHKNIVQLVGYCADSMWKAMQLPNNGTYTMVQVPTRLLCFEYLPNNSLDKHISDETSGLDWNKRFKIMKEICNGLHFLHRECHLIHLDLKPENILMDDTFIPKIADFGLSRLLGGQKSRTVINGNIAGSCGYMAPEYILQGVVSPMADIFSFGVIMIEMITGCRDYPLSTIPFLLQPNENRGQSSEMSLQRYQEHVIGRWRNVFQKEEKYTSPEIYIQQVKRCITIALRCVTHDSTRRPSICDIVQMLNAVEREDSKHNIYQICCASQKRDLISTQPIELSFRTNEKELLSSCMLQLDNNIKHPVAFRILTENVKTNLLWQPCGIVLPRSRYGIHVKVGKLIANENIALESTIVGDQSLPLPNTTEAISQYNHFFMDANKEGREVQQVQLSAVSVDEPRNMIVELEYPAGMISMVVHPTEPRILSCHNNGLVQIWDYCAQETVKSSNLPLESICAATFIVRNEWLLVTDYIGNIRVYNYMTLEEIKMFNADNSRVESFDIHPTEPYLLSASPNGWIKLWDWEKNWESIKSDTLTQRVNYVKFNLKDPSYYCSTSWSGVQIWNTNHSLPVFTFQLWGVNRIDFFTRDNHLHIIVAKRQGPPEIWDCLSRTCVEKLEGHGDDVGVVCTHPELPVLMTGSNDGTIRLWNSFDFRCEGILHCGLGKVLNITCLTGSKRIVVGLDKGVARLTLPELRSHTI